MRNFVLFAMTMLFACPTMFGQCINNPSLQSGDINPAPLTSGAGGILQFTYFENLLEYTDDEGDPISLTVCLLNLSPVGGPSAVSGSFAAKFNWVYDPGTNCLQGMQNQDILSGDGGVISVAFNQVNEIECPDNQMGFNANLQPAACMNGINQTTDDTESVYTCTSEILPIELSHFDGKVEDCKGVLSWGTSAEIDFSHFELEKSIDGERFFLFETIQGKGSPTTSASYSFVDETLRATNLYRLKSVDLDGTFSYSKLILLEKDCAKANLAFDIFPNPVIYNQLTVQIDSEWRNQDATIVITDVLGRVLMERPTVLGKGGNEVKLNVGALADASYFISVQGDKWEKEAKKFVKLSE